MRDHSSVNLLTSQEAAFAAIKAKHQNLHAYLAGKRDPLILELADMILLISAQLALQAGSHLPSEALAKADSATECRPRR